MMRRRPKGYWKEWKNVEPILQTVMEDNHGLIPSSSEFIRRGLSGLPKALSMYHGGINKVRERMGVANLRFCNDCKTVKDDAEFRPRSRWVNGKAHYFRIALCEQCEYKRASEHRKTLSGRTSMVYARLKSKCKKSGIPFDLDVAWIMEHIQAIGDRCELTGIAFTKPDGTHHSFCPYALSVDRIDPHGGYVKSNVRFIIAQLNGALSNGTDKEFELIAKRFLEKRGYACIRKDRQ